MLLLLAAVCCRAAADPVQQQQYWPPVQYSRRGSLSCRPQQTRIPAVAREARERETLSPAKSQAQKFAGSSGPQAEALTDAIAAAASPEEAARLGRTAQRERPHLQARRAGAASTWRRWPEAGIDALTDVVRSHRMSSPLLSRSCCRGGWVGGWVRRPRVARQQLPRACWCAHQPTPPWSPQLLFASLLQRPDWYEQQTAVMKAALRAKFTSHHAPRAMLLSTAAPSSSSGSGDSGGAAGATGPDGGRLLVEASPHDYYWGRGFDGSGQNMLGRLLMELRGELLAEEAADEWRAPAAEMQRR